MLTCIMIIPVYAADAIVDSVQSEEEYLEQLSTQFENMTNDELNKYIEGMAVSSLARGTTVTTSSVKGAWLAAAQLAKNAGYTCAATLVVCSVNGTSYTETDGGAFGKKIKATSVYKNYFNTVKSSKKTSYSGSLCFTSGDLFYALHNVSIKSSGTLVGTAFASYIHTVSDVFDFAYDNNYNSLFTTLVNNWAWLCQQTGVLNKISVKITFID